MEETKDKKVKECKCHDEHNCQCDEKHECHCEHDNKKECKHQHDKKEKHEHKEIEDLKKLVRELQDKNLRTQAELINYRNRKDEEVSRMLKYANEDIVLELLPIIDSFERAIKMDDTNLEDSVEDIIRVNTRRWEIEESFRIRKTDFKSRPVYHSKDEMIKAHFITCFLSLIVYRYVEKKLDEKYTAPEIIETLRNMNMKLENETSYIPNYIRTDLTDDLHDEFGFRTDFEVISEKNFKKIFSK